MCALFRPRTVRSTIAEVLCAATLSGCVTNGGGGDTTYLTPEQRRLRAQDQEFSNRDFNQTVGEGALGGALLGGLIGLLAGGKRHRASGALIGAGAGAVVGAGAGYYVARKKQQYVNENQRLDSMTADVRADNARLEAYV